MYCSKTNDILSVSFSKEMFKEFSYAEDHPADICKKQRFKDDTKEQIVTIKNLITFNASSISSRASYLVKKKNKNNGNIGN